MSTDPNAIVAAIREDGRRARSKANRAMLLGALFLAGFLVYSTWFYRQLSKLDAEAFTDIAAGRLIRTMPELEIKVRKHVIALAPQASEQGKRALLQVPAMVRNRFETTLVERTRPLLAAMERELNDALDRQLDESVQRLAQSAADAQTPQQQMALVAADLRSAYREQFAAMGDRLYDHYSGGMKDIERFLQRTREKNPSERQRLERELVECSLVIFPNVDLFAQTIAKGDE